MCLNVHIEDIQPGRQSVHHVHDAVFVHVVVVDAVGVGALWDLGDVVCDLLWLERVGDVEDEITAVETCTIRYRSG